VADLARRRKRVSLEEQLDGGLEEGSGKFSIPSWLRRRAEYAVYAVCAVGILILAALPVDVDSAPALEVDAFRVINGFPDFLDAPLWVAMQLGNLIAAPAAAAVAGVFRRWRLMVGFLLLGAGKWILARVVKDLVIRHRPGTFLDDVIVRDEFGAGKAFVSGHAVIAVGIATLAHPYLGKRGRIILWTLAGLVCFGRVYVGAHLPLDVIGGAALGVAIGAVIHAVLGVSRSQEVR